MSHFSLFCRAVRAAIVLMGGVLLAGSPSLGRGQTPADTFRLVLELPGATVFSTVDNLGNVYRIRSDNSVEKFAASGRLLTQYSNNRLGRASAVDGVNPMKTVVWYSDFRTVLFLDRSLTPLGELNLLQAGYPEVRVVASARDGNLWIYDEVTFRLRKITPEGRQLFESPNLAQLFPEQLSITWMEECNNQLYAVEPTLGLLLFDAFAQPQGQYLPSHIPVQVEVMEDQLLYVHDGQLFREDMRLGRSGGSPLPLVPEADGNWRFFENHLLFEGDKGLYVFRR